MVLGDAISNRRGCFMKSVSIGFLCLIGAVLTFLLSGCEVEGDDFNVSNDDDRADGDNEGESDVDSDTDSDVDGDADTDTDSDGDSDGDGDSETDSDADGAKQTKTSEEFDGQCPLGQVCLDLTGSGNFGCVTSEGAVPPGAPEGCGEEVACPDNNTCYSYADGSGTVCIQDCFECVPGDDATCEDGKICVQGMCKPEPCTEGSCDDDFICWEGTCIPDIGDGPGEAGTSECELPPLMCDPVSLDCGELVQFDPTATDGYVDYAENGETEDNQYRSWLRRDTVMLVQYAAAKVACLAGEWDFGNGGPVGLIDMSEENGAIPGESIGQPGHPAGTHVNGYDIDVAYYQVNTPDNRARPICDHYENGAEAYHCTATPHLLDPWRQALFIGALQEHPDLRVIGCDGKAGPMLYKAMDTLCNDGWMTPESCGTYKLTYEETNNNYGWYLFHHHHIHVSFSGTSTAQSLGYGTTEHYKQYMDPFTTETQMCLVPGCDQRPLVDYQRKFFDLIPLAGK